MPAHNRLRPNDRHRIEHTRYEPVEPYEDKAVEPAEGRALMATPTQQYIQLMTKRYHLCLKRLSRPEEVDDHPLEQIQELEHPEFMARFGPSRQADGICDRDTAMSAAKIAADLRFGRGRSAAGMRGGQIRKVDMNKNQR